jgi:hypothetical protein
MLCYVISSISRYSLSLSLSLGSKLSRHSSLKNLKLIFFPWDMARSLLPIKRNRNDCRLRSYFIIRFLTKNKSIKDFEQRAERIPQVNFALNFLLNVNLIFVLSPPCFVALQNVY